MKQAVIANIAKSKVLSDIIHNVAKDTKDEDLKDLEQDLYVELLEKDEDLIDYLNDNEQMNYFLTRMVINNINSITSRYYYKYKKNKAITDNIDETKEQGQDPDYLN